ncbi:MAG: hypothetical protein UR20_C0054G0003 [Candidatus Woesebacteria bacterium GW2011_GWE2_31_6]|nr:MAG: hypothetical protein UR20_C0054G0003 [Candidatus Woesebacteria bacterium GW2011_GWE2_31_6]
MRKIIIENVDLMDKYEEAKLKETLKRLNVEFKEVGHNGD